jgi:hypothetical protein
MSSFVHAELPTSASAVTKPRLVAMLDGKQGHLDQEIKGLLILCPGILVYPCTNHRAVMDTCRMAGMACL